METTIFEIPIAENKKITTNENNVTHKLFMYGFNTAENSSQIKNITSNENYKDCLLFNWKKTNIYHELFEIISLFKLFDKSHDILKNDYYDVLNEISHDLKKKQTFVKNKASFTVHKFNNNSEEIANTFEKKCSAIIHFNDARTNDNVSAIYCISSMFKQAYIVKPIASPFINDECYLLLMDFEGNAIKTFGNVNEFSNNYSEIIKKFNTVLISEKYKLTSTINKYISNKIFKGETYDKMIAEQKKNTEIWNDLFSKNKADLKKMIKK